MLIVFMCKRENEYLTCANYLGRSIMDTYLLISVLNTHCYQIEINQNGSCSSITKY
jgi:hypothetical protein